MNPSLPPDEFVLGDPALAPLLGALTADPTPGELAGQHAALAMYRAARATGPAARFRRTARLAGRARGAGGRAYGRSRRARGVRLATVSALVVLAGGFAAAGYAVVLPAPLQYAAHLLFGFPGSRGGAVAVRGGHGRGTPGGSASRGGVHPARHGKSGSSILTVPNSSPSPSGPGTLTTPVSLSLHAAKQDKRDSLLVKCRFAAPGDVVWLQVRQGSARRPAGRRPGAARVAGSGRAGHQTSQARPDGAWQTVGKARLGTNGEAFFEIAPRVGLDYRVVLLATPAHGRLLSNIVVITAGDLRWKP
jgi:hypothetical protein